MEKHSVSRLSYLFSHLHLLSSYSFSSTLSLLSASALPCFSSVHIETSLTSKLPSTIHRKWKKVWSYWSAWLLDRQSRASKNSQQLASSGPASSLAAFFFLSSSSGLPSAPFLRSGGVFSSSPEWCPERWGLDLSGFFSMEKEEKMKKIEGGKG